MTKPKKWKEVVLDKIAMWEKEGDIILNMPHDNYKAEYDAEKKILRIRIGKKDESK